MIALSHFRPESEHVSTSNNPFRISLTSNANLNLQKRKSLSLKHSNFILSFAMDRRKCSPKITQCRLPVAAQQFDQFSGWEEPRRSHADTNLSRIAHVTEGILFHSDPIALITRFCH
jgi:hypothetical protein